MERSHQRGDSTQVQQVKAGKRSRFELTANYSEQSETPADPEAPLWVQIKSQTWPHTSHSQNLFRARQV